MMMDLMRKGMSFDEAHDLAQKKYPSPKKEMKGMMHYDEKKAAWHMKKGAKPDFLDMDKDGDRKEPMTKALKDKEKAKASIEYVFMETSIQEVVAVVQASGETKLKISGIAFHEGFNKNKWSITRAGVENVVKQMIGSDLTLNHPPTKEKGVGFVRNMDGGVNDAVVGVVTEAKVVDVEAGMKSTTLPKFFVPNYSPHWKAVCGLVANTELALAGGESLFRLPKMAVWFSRPISNLTT